MNTDVRPDRAERRRAKKAEAELLERMRKRLKRAIEADRHNRTAAIEDLKFGNGEQTDEAEKQRRDRLGLPSLEVNLLPKFADQVIGDGRLNRPQIKVRAGDDDSDVQTAKVREGHIRAIEHASNAPAIYDYALQCMVEGDRGAWRVLTRYTEENPFLQEIYLERIPNPFTVVMDPSGKSEVYADAQWGFVQEKMPVEEFRAKYPKASLPGEMLKTIDGTVRENWWDQDTVTVVEYFEVEETEEEMALLEDGTILTKQEAEEKIRNYEQARTRDPSLPLPTIEKTRTVKKSKVQQRICTAAEVLEGPHAVPGTFIPIVLATGKERNIEGKRHTRGLYRDAKGPQRLVNYWTTKAAQVVSNAAHNPWVGTAKQFEGYETDYALAASENYPLLKHNVDPDAPMSKPERSAAGGIPSGVLSQLAEAKNDLRDTIGMYNRDVGAVGPERTGIAIREAQRPGDVGTFVFHDNLRRAVAHGGRIIDSMLAEIYDTERDVTVRGQDDSESVIPINTTVGRALGKLARDPERYSGLDKRQLRQKMRQKGENAPLHEYGRGRYSVYITTGPSFTTQRQEAAERLERFAKIDPKLMMIAPDLVYRTQDFHLADEIADRYKRTMPAHIVPPKEGEPPRQQPPPPPAAMVALAKIEVEKAKLEIQKLRLVKELQDAKGEVRKTVLEILRELHGPAHPADGMGVG